MRYIKKFKIYEAVIIPNKLDNKSVVNSFDSLVEYGANNDFNVVEYDEFYNSLSNPDKRNAPPRQGPPFFALFHPERKKPMFVINDRNAARFIPDFKTIVDDMIGHEKIHKEQSIRKGDIEYSLPSPTDSKAYFSNLEEVMAFSWTIANGLSKTNKDIKSAFDNLDGRDRSIRNSEHGRIWSTIKSICDEDIIKRYRKYIYMYLENIFSK